MLSVAIEIIAATQGAGVLDRIRAGVALRSMYKAATQVVTDDHVGEGAPNAIFDPKFRPRPVFLAPARPWR